jgi:hypothetical protein
MKEENKEEFCAPCALAIPAALGAVGIGTSAVGSQDKDKQTRDIIMWSGIGVLVLSIIVFIYLKMSSSDCKQCKAK